MPFSRDHSNYLNRNKKLIVSSLPSASFLQVQSSNKQIGFKVNRNSLQGCRNVSAQPGSNDPSASYSISISDFHCDSKQMTNYPWFELNSCLLSPPQPASPPLTFSNMILFLYIPSLLMTPWSTQSLCPFHSPYEDIHSTVLALS